MTSFHIREDVAPLKLQARERARQERTGFHIREDVAPLKRDVQNVGPQHGQVVSTFVRMWLH